jgi:hypothetical protein
LIIVGFIESPSCYGSYFFVMFQNTGTGATIIPLRTVRCATG